MDKNIISQNLNIKLGMVVKNKTTVAQKSKYDSMNEFLLSGRSLTKSSRMN